MILKSAFFAWPVSLGVGSHQISRSFSDPSKKSKSPDISVLPYACVFPPFWPTPLNKTVKHSLRSAKNTKLLYEQQTLTANLPIQLPKEHTSKKERVFRNYHGWLIRNGFALFRAWFKTPTLILIRKRSAWRAVPRNYNNHCQCLHESYKMA